MMLGNHKRVYGLDILRTIAIVTVVYGHGGDLYFSKLPSTLQTLYSIFRLDGVTIFFVLSGFLIGGILLKIINSSDCSIKDLTGFWIRRWFRTLPTYYLILFIIILWTLYTQHALPTGTYRFLFFSQNLYYPQIDFFNPSWSLSVEEWFYLLIPACLFGTIAFFKSNRRNTILGWVIFVILVVSIIRIVKLTSFNYTSLGDWDMNIRKEVITRLDSIMLGFLGAYLAYYKVPFWTKNKNILFYIGIALFVLPKIYFTLPGSNDFVRFYLILTTNSIATLLTLPKLSTLTEGSGKIYKLVTFISIISYSMYLTHKSIVGLMFIPTLFNHIHLPFSNVLIIAFIKYCIFWAATIGISYLLYKYYEYPFTNLRERFKKKGTALSIN